MSHLHGSRGRAHASPRLEALEDRHLLSVTFSQVGDVLTIKGDAKNNTVTVWDDGSDAPNNITAKGDKKLFTSSSAVHTINIDTGAGNDTINYQIGDLNWSSRNITINAGVGNDKVTLTTGTLNSKFQAYVDLGPGNDTYQGSTDGANLYTPDEVEIIVEGGAGNDKMTFSNLSDLDGGGTYYAALGGGSGNDTLKLTNQANLTTGTQAMLELRGGSGNDHLTLSSAGALEVGPGTTKPHLIMVADGESGNDVINTTFQGAVNSGYVATADTGGSGDDQITMNVQASVASLPGSPSTLEEDVTGDAGNDKITVNNTVNLNGLQEVLIDGGDGADTINYNQTGVIAPGSLAGWTIMGDDTSTAGGNDTINVAFTGSLYSAGNPVKNAVLELFVMGQFGDDTVTANLNVNPGSAGMIGLPGNRATMHGGPGKDKLTFAIRTPGSVTQVNAQIIGDAGVDQVFRTANVLGDPSNEVNTIIA